MTTPTREQVVQVVQKATDPCELERRILDPNIAKGEAEWWASRRIADLEATIAELTAQRDEAMKLLAEARRTFEMWKDVAPAVSLCADIDAAIAKSKEGK